MVNNIRNNITSEISAKKVLNTLNEIKNVGVIKYKRRTPGRKLLNLFNDLLDTILIDKTLKSENQKDDENDNENEDDENENENDETLMSSKDENKNAEN